MIKSPSSQQVESGQIKGISQRVESGASPLSPNSSVPFRVPYVVTQYEYYVHVEEDKEDVLEDPKSEVQISIAAHKPKRNI